MSMSFQAQDLILQNSVQGNYLIHKREVWTQNYKFISKNTYVYTYNELSNKRGVFLILFEKIFPTPCFFTYTNEKKSQLHVLSPTLM